MRTVIIVGAGAVVFGIAAAVMGGCIRSSQFRCGADNECTNAGFQGRCESVGICSFPDPECETGYRFGETLGPESGQCVGTPDVDASVDAPPDELGRLCFGTGVYELCFAAPPAGIVALSGTLDTTNDPRCGALPASWMAAGQPDACMVIGRQIDVTTAVTVTGPRPLVLVGDTVSIGGTIDVASHRGGVTGAGANATLCAAFAGTPVNDVNGAGGGAGGSFMTVGGNGGRGEAAGATGGTAAPAAAMAPMVLRGGCAGQLGGTGTEAAAPPGAGGGALYIAAGTLSFSTTGTINASGAGGGGGGTYSGGSGGGAGGMIVIHAFQLGSTTGGRLVANGGGGASGGDANTDGTGGSDPSTAMVTMPAAGGPGGNGGATGGNGFAGTSAAQTGVGAQNNKGGGGGGGGGGYIQVNVALPGVAASPMPAIVP